MGVVAPATCVAHAPECRGTSGTRCGVSTRRRSDGQRGIVGMQRDRRDPSAQIPLEHRHLGMARMSLVLTTPAMREDIHTLGLPLGGVSPRVLPAAADGWCGRLCECTLSVIPKFVWCRMPLAHPWDAGHSLVWPAVAPAALTPARPRSAYPIGVLSFVR